VAKTPIGDVGEGLIVLVRDQHEGNFRIGAGHGRPVREGHIRLHHNPHEEVAVIVELHLQLSEIAVAVKREAAQRLYKYDVQKQCIGNRLNHRAVELAAGAVVIDAGADRIALQWSFRAQQLWGKHLCLHRRCRNHHQANQGANLFHLGHRIISLEKQKGAEWPPPRVSVSITAWAA
jgi:hypothetical protein